MSNQSPAAGGGNPGSGVSLEQIIAPVKHELADFEKHFRSSLQSNIGLVDTVVRYIIKRKGKRIRPALVLLSAAACRDINDATFRGAALVELLHTATLIHDDVVDESDKRRGLASINAVWKNKVAVLLGDYVLSRGLLLSLENDDVAFLHSTSTAVKRMSEGELLQIQKSRQFNTDEETYFQIIGDKTASLLSTCCEIGALSSTADPVKIDAMRRYGENLGIAFQIRDDILDFLGNEHTIGKPVGGDLKEKKLTLPLIHALAQVQPKQRRAILRLLKNGVKRKQIEEIVGFVKDNGGIEYAVGKAEEFRRQAVECLDSFPASAQRNSLEQLAQFVITRSK